MIFSRGWPCFSYIASMKKGSMTSIMHMAATLLPAGPRSKKKSGTPMSAPPEKQMTCRFVRFRISFCLTFVRSFGMGTYAKSHLLAAFAAHAFNRKTSFIFPKWEVQKPQVSGRAWGKAPYVLPHQCA